MNKPQLDNTLRTHREHLGLSQQGLADLAGVSRQAIIAIEAGRQVPSTSLGLRLARALRCGVEDLFRLRASGGLTAKLVPPEGRREREGAWPLGGRVAVSEIGGSWVAHRLPPDPTMAADGIVAAEVSGRTAVVHALADPEELRRNVIVSGCAPILGSLVQRVGRLFADARATWIPTNSSRSLELLEAGYVHVAGIHLFDVVSGEDHVEAVGRRFPGQRMLVINLTRWRQGFVVQAGNPLAIRAGAGLLRPGLRLARREEGAAAHELLMTLLSGQGVEDPVLRGPVASGHAEVAQLVRCGAADVGVAIESVALAAGLDFVPLTEERFDLVVPAASAEATPVSRLIEAIEESEFRAEIAQVPGYDSGLSGQVITVDAA